MHERPIADLVDALRGIGARIDYAGKDGFAPLLIRPGVINAENTFRRPSLSKARLTKSSHVWEFLMIVNNSCSDLPVTFESFIASEFETNFL